MFFLVFLACLSVAYGNLIVGGEESKPGSRPYQVALFSQPTGQAYYQYCGGTLVHENWVVCAAHCAGGAVYVGLGYHDLNEAGKQIIPGSWTVHEQYNSNILDNDISLIRLSTPATLSSTVKTISIAASGSDVSGGTPLLVSGWGSLSSGGYYPDKLRQVIVQGISRSQCRSNYGSSAITDNMVCAAASGKDACQGDSGGPIVSGYNKDSHVPSTTLEGIVSWGYGCADPSYPGVYTRVANYCSWLNSKTGGDVSC